MNKETTMSSNATHYVTELLRAALVRRFSCVVPPASFAAIEEQPESFVVVAESSSVVIAALLEAFLKRSGSDVRPEYGTADAQPRHLRWIGINDDAAIAAILSQNPAQQFVTLTLFERRGPIRSNPAHKLSLFRLIEIVSQRND